MKQTVCLRKLILTKVLPRCKVLEDLSKGAREYPGMRFEEWKEDDYPSLDHETKRVI